MKVSTTVSLIAALLQIATLFILLLFMARMEKYQTAEMENIIKVAVAVRDGNDLNQQIEDTRAWLVKVEKEMKKLKTKGPGQ